MRPTKDALMIGIAMLLSTRATCAKRHVGCVLTDIKGRILSTGYNGTPSGTPHCTDHPCDGVYAPAGSDKCQGVHAEINALMQCKDVDAIHTCYVTTMPCNNCMKSLLNTNCQRIATLGGEEPAAASKWRNAGRTIELIDTLL